MAKRAHSWEFSLPLAEASAAKTAHLAVVTPQPATRHGENSSFDHSRTTSSNWVRVRVYGNYGNKKQRVLCHQQFPGSGVDLPPRHEDLIILFLTGFLFDYQTLEFVQACMQYENNFVATHATSSQTPFLLQAPQRLPRPPNGSKTVSKVMRGDMAAWFSAPVIRACVGPEQASFVPPRFSEPD